MEDRWRRCLMCKSPTPVSCQLPWRLETNGHWIRTAVFDGTNPHLQSWLSGSHVRGRPSHPASWNGGRWEAVRDLTRCKMRRRAAEDVCIGRQEADAISVVRRDRITSMNKQRH